MSEMPTDIVQALIENAKRLGLTWSLIPATVQETSVDTSKILVIVDGDDQPIYVDSLLGGLPANARVMLMTVPPSGNYIIGLFGATAQRQSLIYANTLKSTSTLTLTTAFQVVPGCTVTITLDQPALLDVEGVVDFFNQAAGVTTCIGSVFINSVAQFSFNNLLRLVNDRDTSSNAETIELAAGEHIIDLRARRDTAAGTQQAIIDNSRLIVKLFQ